MLGFKEFKDAVMESVFNETELDESINGDTKTVNYKAKEFKDVDKWMAAGESLDTKLHLRKSGPCWELVTITGELFGQMYMGQTFTGKPYGWLCMPKK
jgi:hypothetical protein